MVRRERTASAVMRALVRKQPEADETLGQLAIGLFSDEFVAGVAPPEINAADLKEIARERQKSWISEAAPERSAALAADSQEEFLKGIIDTGVGQARPSRRRRRIASGHVQSLTASCKGFRDSHK